ncbi:hypothetical protein [Burkholderia ubonensis]|uniref:hypothetical protein n=1 Tax=Burkholderia ubonensis TaxID=101571 RepID=UPI0009ABAD04|nr:hypothetical protein [Burkholderia ubonensis]
MAKPKNFSPANAEGENYELDPKRPEHVIVYRFGNKDIPHDWLSRKRQEAGGNYPRPSDQDLNDWALKQSSYGSSSENAQDNPFLSVATSYTDLFNNGEVWVQKILEKAPNLVKLSVPFATVFRSSPTKLISKSETEWLYYDGDASLLSNNPEILPNPYLKS